MSSVLIDICHRLYECLNRVRRLGDLTLFNAVTGFIDYDGLSYIFNYLRETGDVRIVVGDLGPVLRIVYERWRDVVRVYPDLHAKLYLLGNGLAIVGSANLTRGGLYGNVELNVMIRDGELYEELVSYFEGLWRGAKPLTEDYVEDVEEVEVRSAKRGVAEFVNRVNKALASVLGVNEECLTTFDPRRCSVIVAEAINRRFRDCGDLPENCVAHFVAEELNLETRDLARRLVRGPGSAVVAGHPLCWVRAFINLLNAGRVDVSELSSGVRIYEAMVRVASRECPGWAGEVAREELVRLGDERYRDDYVRWKIPYRLLPLALVLPITDCRLVGARRRDGSVLRGLACNH